MELGRHFDPYSYAESKGISVTRTPRVQDGGLWDASTRTVWIDDKLDPTAARCALTYALAWAEVPDPTPVSALQWAGDRLVPKEDLNALVEATNDCRLWARALNVPMYFLGSVAFAAAA